ncbi:uncharacterized protein ColSpa_03847 [Colletotrichum spaethianum]|uniref:Uncharacterized protein n=1 Tax=Colletotrichum spaethianum TaxID=700344 RepID=A0AA37L8A5_9PEZI|nr:uncharacterized protein ColSpa_03847 [Colletotrichum spaethianum]GKT43666.1 hypothetical protein ColSpa_03847 [Colletotrichum spaethianum]
MDAEEAPGSEALRENEERERSTFKRMQIECTRQRRFFERVRVETALAREAALGPPRDDWDDDRRRKPQPDAGMQGTLGLMASPTVVKSGFRDPMRQQVRFFQTLALQFRRQTQAGAGAVGGGGGDGGKNTCTEYVSSG